MGGVARGAPGPVRDLTRAYCYGKRAKRKVLAFLALAGAVCAPTWSPAAPALASEPKLPAPPAAVYSAAAGSGMSDFGLVADVWRSVPASAKAGNQVEAPPPSPAKCRPDSSSSRGATGAVLV